MSKPSSSGRGPSRRRFLKTSLAGSVGLALPTFLPRTYLFGAQVPPSRRITVAQIGCGRMGLEDMQATMAHDLCRMVAVCDLDSKRLEAARLAVERHYRGRGESGVDVKAYRDYHEVLAIDIGASQTSLNILKGSSSVFMRDVALGCLQINQKIMSLLDCSYEQAELLKFGEESKKCPPRS